MIVSGVHLETSVCRRRGDVIVRQQQEYVYFQKTMDSICMHEESVLLGAVSEVTIASSALLS